MGNKRVGFLANLSADRQDKNVVILANNDAGFLKSSPLFPL